MKFSPKRSAYSAPSTACGASGVSVGRAVAVGVGCGVALGCGPVGVGVGVAVAARSGVGTSVTPLRSSVGSGAPVAGPGCAVRLNGPTRGGVAVT